MFNQINSQCCSQSNPLLCTFFSWTNYCWHKTCDLGNGINAFKVFKNSLRCHPTDGPMDKGYTGDPYKLCPPYLQRLLQNKKKYSYAVIKQS